MIYKVPIEESQCFREKIQVVSWRGEKKKSRREGFAVLLKKGSHSLVIVSVRQVTIIDKIVIFRYHYIKTLNPAFTPASMLNVVACLLSVSKYDKCITGSFTRVQ